MGTRDPRDHGFGPAPEVTNHPTVVNTVFENCPNCGCRPVYQIQVRVRHPLLKGNGGTGTYVGCAACPWAGPMASVAAVPLKTN